MGEPIEACRKPDQIVIEYQVVSRIMTDIENDLALIYIGCRHYSISGDLHRKIGGQTVIGTPFMDGANEIGFGGNHFFPLFAHGFLGGS